MFRASGRGAYESFRRESGGHRWQRKPPNEKRDKVHTSTITVAVLREAKPEEFRIEPKDLDIKTTRGSGPGGQARNKTESCVVITYKPTGLVVRVDSERSQSQNREFGLGILRSRLLEQQQNARVASENAARRSQVGTGMRGDKIRTIRADGVTDHVLGKRMDLRRYEKGFVDDLW